MRCENVSKAKDVVIGGIYEHYKHNFYKVHGIARHSESLEEMVHYECLYENDLGVMWVRPINLFLGSVEINGEVIPRFRLVKSP
jgi:hypothetical protein